MKSFRLFLTLCFLAVALGCIQVSVSAQAVLDDSRASTITAAGSMVRWQVAGTHAAVTMTVSAPDGQVFRKEFKRGASPEFTIFDNEGNRLADGEYRYELRYTPEFGSGVKEKLASGRLKNDDDAVVERDLRKKGMLQPGIVQSGSFTILKGSVIIAGAATEEGGSGLGPASPRPEPMRPSLPTISAVKPKQHHRLLGLNPDQVIPDDLIVQGSLCVGLDCVNNESFGFDTIRLKENNTRIKFDDTSTSAGFPANDWQITANDSASGGSSKFSIEDISGSKVPFTITAGAATNSVFVDSTGRLGLRTSTPVLDIHANTSNTPAIRLEQNNSGGFTAQTWDIGANEANFFVRDVTGGSKLSLRIRPGAPTSSVDIASDGKVGIGTASPNDELHVSSSAASTFAPEVRISNTNQSSDATLKLYHNNDDGWRMRVGFGSQNLLTFDSTTDDTTFTTRAAFDSTGRFGIGTTAPDQLLSVNGDASKLGGATWQTFSDERLKNIKGNYTSGLRALMRLQPIRFEYKSDNALGLKLEGEHFGFGAQSVQRVIPEAVTKTQSGYLMVNNDPIIMTMLNAIKEQQKQIEQLKGEVRKLRATRRHR
jgi:Chaperone of endosialidase